jgi:hypothetical protein
MTVTIWRKKSPERAEIYGGVVRVESDEDFLMLRWAGESDSFLAFRQDTLSGVEIDNLGGTFA